MTIKATSDAVISQSREVADAIKAMHDTIRQFQIIDPLKEIRRTLKVIEMADPFKELREAIRLIQLRNPVREVQQAVAAIQQLPDPLLGLREHVRTFQSIDPLRPVREAIQEMQALARAPAIQDAIRAMHSSTTAYRQLLQGIIPANFFEESFREAVARFARVETETGWQCRGGLQSSCRRT